MGPDFQPEHQHDGQAETENTHTRGRGVKQRDGDVGIAGGATCAATTVRVAAGCQRQEGDRGKEQKASFRVHAKYPGSDLDAAPGGAG